MNKRELIKALFKDPTIKALYESGHFNATDINRAILTEAQSTSMDAKQADADKLIAQINAKSEEATTNTKELEVDATKALRATAVAANKMGNNPAKKSTLADLAAAQKALRARGAKLPVSKKAAQAAAKTEPSSDDKISAQQLDNLGQNAAQADIEVDKIAQTPLNNNTVAQVAQQLKKDLVNPDEPFLDDDPQKVADAVKAAQQGGEGDQAGQSDKIEEYVEIFDEFVSPKAKDKFNQVLGIQPNESDMPANLIARAFAAYYLMETGTLNEAEGDLAEYETHAKKFVTEMELNSQQQQTLEDILNNQNFHDAVAAVRDSIKTSGEDTAGDEGDTGTASLDQWLSDKPEAIQQFVNSNELFKTNLAKAYSEAVDPEPEAETQQTTANPPAQPAAAKPEPAAKQQTDQKPAAQPAAAKPEPAAKSQPKKKKRKRSEPVTRADVEADIYDAENPVRTVPLQDMEESLLEGIYLVNEQEGEEQEGEGTDQQGTPVEVDDVRKMLKQLQDLFKNDGININVEEIWTASQEDSTSIDQQQEEALEQQADVNQDKDISSMDQEELDASWKTTLDEFFGKSAESSSFMNQLLLRKQSDLLYGMIKTLTQIIVGDRKPKTGGGTEAGALTDVGDEEEDNNQPATQAAPGKRDDVLEEQVINEIFDSLFGGKKGGNETVQLSRKSTKNMRQHLEAMVTLLRSLKSDINDYSQFSTRESADPRFDGSSLKKAMDAKLAVTQKRIAMLTKQIEISVADQDSDVENMNEDKKSERRLKVQKVREVYNEMRRLYIDSLMVDLENGKVKKAKKSAQGMKDYILNEKEFLSYFPKGMIVGTSVMTLSEAHESMSLIIKKFIDTIRDVVTITKSQEVSKEQLAVAAADLAQIAKKIEALFKVPSQIDKAFMDKYIKLAANDPSSGSLSDEKPSLEDDMLGFVKNWFSDKIGDLANAGLEYLMKLLANGFKGKNMPPEDREEIMEYVVEIQEWVDTLEENQKKAVESLVDFLIRNTDRKNLKQIFPLAVVSEAISDEERNSIKGFTDKFQKDLEGKILKFLNKAEEDNKAILVDLMTNQSDEFIKHLSLTFKIKEKLGDDTAREVSNPTNQSNANEPVVPADVEFDDEEADEKAAAPEAGDEESAAPEAGDDSTADTEEPAAADEDGDDEDPFKAEVKRIRKDIAEYERKAGTGEAKAIMEDFLPQEGAKKLGKDSIEALYSIIEIAKLMVKNFAENFAGDYEEVNESVSKIFNKIKKSANAFMQNQKARSNFSKFEDEFRRYLYDRSEKAKPYLMYLLKFMNGAELRELLKVLEENNGDITEARKEMKDLYTPSPTDSDVDNLEEALKPIIETMLKEHYNH